MRPWAEPLETRDCPSVTIQLDYTYDANNFFDTPAKRAILQVAADTVGARLGDNLTAIAPTGGDHWTEVFPDPATGTTRTVSDPVVPANTIVVYVGGRPLVGAGELGVGSTGGTSSVGTNAWNDLVSSRGQPGALLATPNDFGPWGGSISFDTNAKFYFGTDPTAQKATENSFLSVAFHELFHVLGFGTAGSWKDQVTPLNRFAGPASTAFYEGAGLPPLSPDHAHWAAGTTSGGTETVMDPSILIGTRELPTRLDYAGLQDIGWSLLADPDSTISTAGAPAISSSGSVTLTGLSIGTDPADPLRNPDPTDVDMFKVLAGPGLVLTATTAPRVGGTSVDTYLRLFDAGGKELKAANTDIYDTLTFALPAAGTYYVGVSSAVNNVYSSTQDPARRLAGPIGDYDLTLRLDPAVGGVTSDLAATISAPSQATAGQSFIYTIGVTNLGPDLAGDVIINQTLPPGVSLVLTHPSARAMWESPTDS